MDPHKPNMAILSSYLDFVKFRTQANPCLSHLVQHMKGAAQSGSRVISLDYRQNKPLIVSEDNLGQHIRDTPPGITRLVFVENINTKVISLLGEVLDLDPIFFADHINTNFGDIENAPPPPSLAILPSTICRRRQLHLHYQQVVDLGNADTFVGAKYAFKTASNTPRNVRRLAPLNGRQLALARGCCSLLVRKFRDSNIALFLVDSPIQLDETEGGECKRYQCLPLNKGFESFQPHKPFSSFISNNRNEAWDKSSMLSSLLHYFQTSPPELQADSPSILELGCYPIRIVLAEWNTYMHLTDRYGKHYEYSLQDLKTRSHDHDLVDLQRWRRRSKQSEQKLALLSDFVTYWMRNEDDKEFWDLTLKDIEHLRKRLQLYSQSIQQMVTVATSMVQLLESQRSIVEAVSIRRLTYIAIVFVPLSWVASIFSMSDTFSPGQEDFWVYFATSLPLLCLVLIILSFPYGVAERVMADAAEKCRAYLNPSPAPRRTMTGTSTF